MTQRADRAIIMNANPRHLVHPRQEIIETIERINRYWMTTTELGFDNMARAVFDLLVRVFACLPFHSASSGRNDCSM